MNNSLHNKISKIIKKVTNEGSAKLHEPLFIGKENQYLKDCIKTTFVSTSGKYIKRFEEKIKKFREDELHHKDIAYKNGATKKGAYFLLDKIIKVGSKIAINISEKV